MKKLFLIFAFVSVVLFGAFSQQITRFGVVDTTKVYQAYFKESTPMRNYESKKADLQKEINKRAEEIKALKQQKIEAAAEEDDDKVSKLEADIAKKTSSLTEYTKSKNLELENLKKSLQNTSDFYKKLYRVIEKVAENEGFTMILSLQQGNGILWYSTSIDVTDKVISELGL